MKELPDNVSLHSRTKVFSEYTIPENLLQSHHTKARVWGKIVVLEGKLFYRILEPAACEFELSPDDPGIVEPEVLHYVAPIGRVRFFIEFHR